MNALNPFPTPPAALRRPRAVERLVTGRPTSDGAGVKLTRVLALGEVLQREVPWERFEAPLPLTPFERKYRDSGQRLFRLGIALPAA